MEPLRLQVALARSGVASRRASEALIRDGRVSVNGSTVREMGTKVRLGADRIEVDGKRIGQAEEPVTVLLHKPRGTMSTTHDPEGRPTVTALVKDEGLRFFPIGRLDYHTEGLLLMSTDGTLMNRLLHPRYKVPKTYAVKVAGTVSPEAETMLSQGVDLDDGRTQPAVVRIVEKAVQHTWLEIIVTEGRNRLVRRMCEAVGAPAIRVFRTALSTLNIEGLRPGEYRYLSAEERHQLYSAAGLQAPKAQPHDQRVRGRAERRPGVLPPGFGILDPRGGRKPSAAAARPRKKLRPRGKPITQGKPAKPRSKRAGR